MIFQGCLRVAQQAGHTNPMLFCGKGLDSFWACAKPGQDRMWGEGQKGLCPGVKGKMISEPGTNKRGMKFERKDSPTKKKVSWL